MASRIKKLLRVGCSAVDNNDFNNSDSTPVNKTSWQGLAAAFALCAPLFAFAGTDTSSSVAIPATYALRDTVTGSMIPRDVVHGAVPFDKRYAELTSTQKAVLRSDYESLGPRDETPFPEQGLRHLVEPMMLLAERQSMHGKLIASVVVGPDGQARTVTVHQSPDEAMTKLAGGALALEKYTPALCDGKPCVMSYVLRLDFDAPQAALPTIVPVFNRMTKANNAAR
ncbi:MAG TPA: energy transducer TonB [Burkholderiaceae bacterium]|nr:energy transducer TonB [Burkholderiaceae bacterium]